MDTTEYGCGEAAAAGTMTSNRCHMLRYHSASALPIFSALSSWMK